MIANLFKLQSLATWIKVFMYKILPNSLDWIVPKIPMEGLNEIYVVSDTTLDMVFCAGVAVGLLCLFMLWSVKTVLTKEKK